MFQCRQVLVRLRQGDSDRDIARLRLMGRRKVMALRQLAAERGWLSPDAPLRIASPDWLPMRGRCLTVFVTEASTVRGDHGEDSERISPAGAG